MPENLENSAVATGQEKVSFHCPKKGNTKKCSKCSNYHTVALISHARKVMLKILQAENFQMLKLDLEKAEAPGIKLLTTVGS